MLAAACGGGVSGSTTTTSSPAVTSSSPTGSTGTTGPQAPSPGVSATTITVGNVSTTGGLVPGLFLGAQIGVQAYFDYVNSTGGVDHRKLVVDDKDDELFCANNKTDTQALIPDVIAFVGSFSIEDECGGEVIPKTIANISDSLDPVVTKLPNTFSPQPIQNGWGTGTLLWLKAHYPNDISHVGALVGNVQTVQDSWKGEEYALQHLGFTVSDVEDYDVGQTSFQASVIRMKDHGVQIVLFDQADVNAIAAFLDASALEGFHPAIFFNSGSCLRRQLHQEGRFGGEQHRRGDSRSALPRPGCRHGPGGAALRPLDQRRPCRLHTGHLFGVRLGVGHVVRAGAAARRSDPNRASLLAALDQITNFDAGGLIAPDDPASKSPPNCFIVAKVANGQWERVSPASGFMCSGTYLYDPSVP